MDFVVALNGISDFNAYCTRGESKLIIKPQVDMKVIMAYAKKKGVDIILYYDRKKGASLGDNKLFKLYSDLGAVGIKYGVMGNNAEFTRKAVETTWQKTTSELGAIKGNIDSIKFDINDAYRQIEI